MKFIYFVFAINFSLCFAQHKTPTKLYTGELNFIDDLNFENMELAIDRQLVFFKSNSSKNYSIYFGERLVTKATIEKGLIEFKNLIQSYKDCSINTLNEDCKLNFNNSIKEKFDIYMPNLTDSDPRQNEELPAHYTSYYSPDFEASLVKTEEYKNPIYSKPSNAELRGRTRVEIDFKDAFKDKNLEIAYVKESLFDIYLLHIEGGGRLKIKNEDGSITYKYLSYSGSNEKSFRFISKYLVEQGYLTSGRSIETQRSFMEKNPDKHEEIYNYCPSYIYFKISNEEPVGIESIILTEKRSMAMDRKFYPHSGILSFISTKRPVRNSPDQTFDDPALVPTEDYSRFFIHQDTGGAIKGKARADLYAGFGHDAEFLANFTNYYGSMYFLILK